MIAARGYCGAEALRLGSKHAPKVKADSVGPYVLLKSVVRSASSEVANMRIRRCPHALAYEAGDVMRIARRVHAQVRSFHHEAPQATAGLVNCVETALREIAHIHAVERDENGQ